MNLRAWAMTALLIACPFSFFIAEAYPESMRMISTAAATWIGMRRRNWLAGVALGFSMYTYKSAPFALAAAGLTIGIYAVARRNPRMIAGGIITLILAVIPYLILRGPIARIARWWMARHASSQHKPN